MGRRFPVSFIRTVSAHVNASRQDVFSYVSDLSRHGEWAGNPLTVRHAGGPTYGAGAEFVTHAEQVLPLSSTSSDGRVIVREEEAPRRLVYEAWDGGGNYIWTFTLREEGNGTRLEHTVRRVTAPAPVRILQPLMWILFGGDQVRRGVANIKSRMEGSVGADAPAEA